MQINGGYLGAFRHAKRLAYFLADLSSTFERFHIKSGEKSLGASGPDKPKWAMATVLPAALAYKWD